jgi:hypothetical protein
MTEGTGTYLRVSSVWIGVFFFLNGCISLYTIASIDLVLLAALLLMLLLLLLLLYCTRSPSNIFLLEICHGRASRSSRLQVQDNLHLDML